MEYTTCEISGQQFMLLADRALYWPSEQVLILSDVHLGKSAHFRKHGLAVPQAADQLTYSRLHALLLKWQPRSFYCLGDLFHSSHNKDWDNVCRLREQHPLIDWILVAGNHDILHDSLYRKAGIHCVQDDLLLKPFALRHEPRSQPQTNVYTICGHIHPAVKLQGKARQKWAAACFWIAKHQLVLPAFGSFTGNQIIAPGPEDRIFSIAGNSIIESF
jgi:DNA ligase-associated metallophosphoesterase